MNEIYQVQVGGVLYDIRDLSKRNFYVAGTQTGPTSSWTGVLPQVSSLFQGLSVDFWLPYAATSDVTLDLELKDGVHTGPIPCYFSGTTRLKSHIPACNVCTLIYQTVTIVRIKYTGWWLLKTYDAYSKFGALTRPVGSATKVSTVHTNAITGWDPGALPNASISEETLNLSFGELPSLSYEEKLIPEISVSQVEVVTQLNSQ